MTFDVEAARWSTDLSLMNAACDEIERLREVLRWYADERRYRSEPIWQKRPPRIYRSAWRDSGKRARAALGKN